MGDVVQTQTPQLMDMGLVIINTLDESSLLRTLATRIRRLTDGPHLSAPDRVFGEVTAVVMIAENSDHDYNYKTYFEIWRGNKEFERQNFLTS